MVGAGVFGAHYTTEDPPEDPPDDVEPVPGSVADAGGQLALPGVAMVPARRPPAPCPASVRARLQALRLEFWVSAELHRRMAPQVWI